MVSPFPVHDIRECYADDNVRSRMSDFLGGASSDDWSCFYVTGDDVSPTRRYDPRLPSELWGLLDRGLEIGRSLWDRESLIVDLDIEYVNFDFPGEPYLHPQRAFALQRPVVRAILKVLHQHEIRPLHLLTGRGHHFAWTVARRSAAFESLVQTGRVPETLERRYSVPRVPTGQNVNPRSGEAFAGIGLVLEYVAHRVIELASRESEIPIQITEVAVGPGRRGREIVSIDLSEYGDPLHMRGIRVPFSAYLKPFQQRGAIGDAVVDRLPALFEIPVLNGEDNGMVDMGNRDLVRSLAKHADVRIPDGSQGMVSLAAEYSRSELRRFHDWFYCEEQHPPEAWPETYDRVPRGIFPPCVRRVIEQPNELLLKPAGIQLVVRSLLALGWHPRHIAGLIRSKYERDHGWGDKWYQYDASSRAEFYTRIFAGLFVAGPDDLLDFNCQSNKEKRYCAHSVCGSNLEDFKRSAVSRKTNERLACRPLNRLFLPNEYP